MTLGRHSSNVVVFQTLPTEEILFDAAISLDSEGFAHHLRSSEPFRGFAVESRNDTSRLSVLVAFEGVEALSVKGFTRGDIGKEVFAEGPFDFTLDPRGKKSPIGFIVGAADYNKALVKFCSQKL